MPARRPRYGSAASRAGMAAAGHGAAVAPEGELLQQVGGGLAGRQEAHLDLARRGDVRHAANEPQRLGYAFAQVDLDTALGAGSGKRGRALEGGAERIEP